MKCKLLHLTLALGLIAIAVLGCTANRVALTDTDLLTLENQSASKVYIAWSDACKQDEGFVITGVLRRRDHVGLPIKAHVDITISSADGQVIDQARSSDIYISKKTTGKFSPFKRFSVHFPDLPPSGASAVLTAHTGTDDNNI